MKRTRPDIRDRYGHGTRQRVARTGRIGFRAIGELNEIRIGGDLCRTLADALFVGDTNRDLL